MYRNLSAKQAVATYAPVCSAEEAEKRAPDARSLIPDQNRKLIPLEFLIDRTVNWIAISSHGVCRGECANGGLMVRSRRLRAQRARPCVSLGCRTPITSSRSSRESHILVTLWATKASPPAECRVPLLVCVMSLFFACPPSSACAHYIRSHRKCCQFAGVDAGHHVFVSHGFQVNHRGS